MMIPFLSPHNMEWPAYLRNIPNSNFGNLKRARNKDKVDILTDSMISGESKDYGNCVDLPTMRGILCRIPKSTKLHLVFTRNLQNSYYQRSDSSFAKVFANHHALKMAYFKIDASMPKTSLTGIIGLPDDLKDGFGVVIFVLISESIKLF